jgi:signal transduction histidine kinase
VLLVSFKKARDSTHTGLAVTAKGEERRRIARELHNGVGQLLSVAYWRLQSALADKHLPAVEAAQEVIVESIQSIRQICRDIRPT